MSKFIIGFGGCSKYYLYILGTVIFKCLRDCMFGFNTINPNSKIGLFGFIPELSNHYLIQSLCRYASFILGGSLFIYISQKRSTNESDLIINDKEKENLELKSLIHNRKSDGSEMVKISQVIKICLIYCVHAELSRIMYLFDFSGLDIWTIDMIFIILFMNKNFVINFGKHQKYSMAFIIITVTILLLISSFLPSTNHDDTNEKEKDKNTYQSTRDITGSNYTFILIFIIFSLLSCIISYQRVKEKVLMDYYFLSPYKLIFFIGIFGFIITSIILTITSNFDCPEEKEYIKEHCGITRIKNNLTEYYYDNFVIYFEELKNNKNSYKFYLEIILMPPIYLIISFFEFTCEILTIYNLNPNYVLLRDNIYYGTSRLIFFLFNLHKNYKHYMTLAQFIILEITEILSILGYAIYLEIIELRFFGLDKDLKKNIIRRSFRETPLKPLNFSFEGSEELEDSLIEEEKKQNRLNESDEF